MWPAFSVSLAHISSTSSSHATGTILAAWPRKSSPSFGKWAGFRLTGREHRYAWIPAGFGHGFLALSEGVEVVYKLTDFWDPAHERVIRWDDPDIAIKWPLSRVTLSQKDLNARSLANWLASRESENFSYFQQQSELELSSQWSRR